MLVEASIDTGDVPSQWAAKLHDRLDAQTRATAGDRDQLMSWLRVQAVGRDTITITEPRVGKYAGLWAAAARRVGLATRLTTATGASLNVTPDDAVDASDRAMPSAVGIDDRWRTRARSWLFDRAEAAGRIAVRTVQR